MTVMRTSLLALCLCGTQAALAQVAPGAGNLLQDTRPPAVPAPPQQSPALDLGGSRAAPLPDSAPFTVRRIHITGNTAFPSEALQGLVRDFEGRQLTLPQLGEAAARITRHYQQHGYPLARAIVPAQKITEGAVSLQVVEARFGAVRVDNQSRVRDALLQATTVPLEAGAPVTDAALDRALLLLSDLPGVGVQAVLQPGAEVGASDLEIAVTHNPPPWGSLTLDNHGNRFVGRARVSAAASLANPLGIGDLLSLGGLSTGKGMDYLNAGYEAALNGRGTRGGLAYSQVDYELGRNLRALDAHGRADVASAWLRHPVLRSRDANLQLQLRYDAKQLEDEVGAGGGSRNARDVANWTLAASGDVRDAWLSGGVTSFSLGWTSGRVRFDDAAAEAIDAASARTRGQFTKWNLQAARLQRVGQTSALYLSLAAQWTGDNLDAAEKMSVGGPFSVRAYDVGVLSGDTGQAATLEFRQELGAVAGGPLQAVAFVDSARIRINRQPWAAGPNRASLSGVGVGLNWRHADGWSLNAVLAARVGGTPSLLTQSASSRAWVVVSKAF
jgi:hemolysin activation/secretion protein